MCRDCAKMLASQTNRCPVCRTIIEGMLEIKVKEAETKDAPVPAASPAPAPAASSVPSVA